MNHRSHDQGSNSRGSVSGGSASGRGLPPGGLHRGGGVNKWMVRILLECILVERDFTT